jgi:hypothetical protein
LEYTNQIDETNVGMLGIFAVEREENISAWRQGLFIRVVKYISSCGCWVNFRISTLK